MAICAARAATSRNVNTAGTRNDSRAARAHRRKVGHSVPHTVPRAMQTRSRTSNGRCRITAHNVNAMAIAASP
jgi:hypothetical protein